MFLRNLHIIRGVTIAWIFNPIFRIVTSYSSNIRARNVDALNNRLVVTGTAKEVYFNNSTKKVQFIDLPEFKITKFNSTLKNTAHFDFKEVNSSIKITKLLSDSTISVIGLDCYVDSDSGIGIHTIDDSSSTLIKIFKTGERLEIKQELNNNLTISYRYERHFSNRQATTYLNLNIASLYNNISRHRIETYFSYRRGKIKTIASPDNKVRIHEINTGDTNFEFNSDKGLRFIRTDVSTDFRYKFAFYKSGRIRQIVNINTSAIREFYDLPDSPIYAETKSIDCNLKRIKTFYKNGKVSTITNYYHCFIIGLRLKFNEDGKLYSTSNYELGKLLGTEFFEY